MGRSANTAEFQTGSATGRGANGNANRKLKDQSKSAAASKLPLRLQKAAFICIINLKLTRNVPHRHICKNRQKKTTQKHHHQQQQQFLQVRGCDTVPEATNPIRWLQNLRSASVRLTNIALRGQDERVQARRTWACCVLL